MFPAAPPNSTELSILSLGVPEPFPETAWCELLWPHSFYSNMCFIRFLVINTFQCICSIVWSTCTPCCWTVNPPKQTNMQESEHLTTSHCYGKKFALNVRRQIIFHLVSETWNNAISTYSWVTYCVDGWSNLKWLKLLTMAYCECHSGTEQITKLLIWKFIVKVLRFYVLVPWC